MDDENNYINGENMHVLTIYLRKLAHFKFKGHFFPNYKNECFGDIRKQGLPISPTSRSTSRVIL
jgi:hypothetical protein